MKKSLSRPQAACFSLPQSQAALKYRQIQSAMKPWQTVSADGHGIDRPCLLSPLLPVPVVAVSSRHGAYSPFFLRRSAEPFVQQMHHRRSVENHRVCYRKNRLDIDFIYIFLRPFEYHYIRFVPLLSDKKCGMFCGACFLYRGAFHPYCLYSVNFLTHLY